MQKNPADSRANNPRIPNLKKTTEKQEKNLQKKHLE
jgi:hypothetical protein